MLIILLVFGIWYMVMGALFGVYVLANGMDYLEEKFDELNEETKKMIHDINALKVFLFLYASVLWMYHIFKRAIKYVIDFIRKES